MPSQSSRKLVTSHASGRKVYAKFQQITGVTTGPGFADGGGYTDVPGLGNVPVTLRTMKPYERFMAQQLYPGVSSLGFMRWRRSANVRSNMRMTFGNHAYRLLGVANYDEANTDIILYLEEWQPTGTVRQ